MSYSPPLRSERMIAAGRTVLAASSLFALWLDPSEPANLAPIAYGLLAAYLTYSFVLLTMVFGRRETSIGLAAASQAIDLVLFSAFVYFTSGPSSPFTAFFVFSLACGTLRWGWKGALWTGAVALAAFLSVGAYFGTVLDDPGFQLSSFVIRGFYLAVIASLFASLGAHEEQLRREATELAARSAASEERIRLARDLHDGVLQSFTGFGLRLAAVRRHLGSGRAEAAGSDLEELQRLIRLDQRDLRFFIRELQPARPDGADGSVPSLVERLEELADRIETTWDVELDFARDGVVAPITGLRGRDAYLLVREAALNAVRHGQAKKIRLSVVGGPASDLEIELADDGRGFPFRGRLDHEQLRSSRVAPRSLLERVESGGGTLEVASTESGSNVRMKLPPRREETE